MDVLRGTIRVERAVSWVYGQAVVETPKSAAGTRTVAILPDVLPAFQRHRDTFTGPRDQDLVFPGPDGEAHLQPSTLYKPWRTSRDTAGRSDLRLHGLPHTGATMATMAAPLWPSSSSDSATAASTPPCATSTPRPDDRQIADALSALARAAESSTRGIGTTVRRGRMDEATAAQH